MPRRQADLNSDYGYGQRIREPDEHVEHTVLVDSAMRDAFESVVRSRGGVVQRWSVARRDPQWLETDIVLPPHVNPNELPYLANRGVESIRDWPTWTPPAGTILPSLDRSTGETSLGYYDGAQWASVNNVPFTPPWNMVDTPIASLGITESEPTVPTEEQIHQRLNEMLTALDIELPSSMRTLGDAFARGLHAGLSRELAAGFTGKSPGTYETDEELRARVRARLAELRPDGRAPEGPLQIDLAAGDDLERICEHVYGVRRRVTRGAPSEEPAKRMTFWERLTEG